MRYLLAGLGAVMLAGGLCGAWEDQPLIRLFDGKSLAGWAPEHTDRFVVRDGRLVQEGGAGWLRSEKTFKNFELHAEVRMLKEGAETGILFRASRESTGKDPYWPVRSYQLQINDGDANLVLLGHGMMAPRFDRKSESLKQALKIARGMAEDHPQGQGTEARGHPQRVRDHDLQQSRSGRRASRVAGQDWFGPVAGTHGEGVSLASAADPSASLDVSWRQRPTRPSASAGISRNRLKSRSRPQSSFSIASSGGRVDGSTPSGPVRIA